MYIDFHKYNYDLVPEDKRDEYIKRDKESYKNVLNKWFSSSVDNVVDRKWEITEIHYLKNVSDFIKLIREGEQLYELGFYTSCIALIGVASEDFCRYLSIQLGKPDYEHLSQFERLKQLKNDKLISQISYDLLDDVRKIRNDCLHYNQNFKQKKESDLKSDSLTTLNNLKNTLKEILGGNTTISETDLTSIFSGIGTGDDIKNTDEIAAKVKNAVSHILKIPMAFDPKAKLQIKTSIYRILEIDIDYDEITLEDQMKGMPVIVEFPETERDYYRDKNFKENDIVSATLFSIINADGLTAEWHLMDLDKQ